MHVVVHSKGGLDTRSYLANFYPKDKEFFKILSFSTLSTPHNGSILADLVIKYNEGIKKAGRSEFNGFPGMSQEMVWMTSVHKGHENLTTDFAAGFNAQNIGRLTGLASEIEFYTYAADLDRNNNQRLDNDLTGECEQEGMASENFGSGWVPDCTPLPKIGNNLYQILRNTASVDLSYQDRPYDTGEPGGPVMLRTAIVTSVPNPFPLPNDSLVTIKSGQGEPYYINLVPENRRELYIGFNQGRNHASIGNNWVAIDVIGNLQSTESRIGDLKRETD
jgi:triacylglycerol esterase/lipase EstA (alpha/beta hydrolase family)